MSSKLRSTFCRSEVFPPPRSDLQSRIFRIPRCGCCCCCCCCCCCFNTKPFPLDLSLSRLLSELFRTPILFRTIFLFPCDLKLARSNCMLSAIARASVGWGMVSAIPISLYHYARVGIFLSILKRTMIGRKSGIAYRSFIPPCKHLFAGSYSYFFKVCKLPSQKSENMAPGDMAERSRH